MSFSQKIQFAALRTEENDQNGHMQRLVWIPACQLSVLLSAQKLVTRSRPAEAQIEKKVRTHMLVEYSQDCLT